MKKENTATRLKEIMETMGLRQVDILRLALPYCEKYNVKMNKSDISQYCSGKTEPNQDKLFVLGVALNVDEAWLMGYDVPMKRNNYEDQNLLKFDAILEEIQRFIESAGYKMSFSSDSDDIVIKTHDNDIVACMHDYELVGKYESLQHKGTPVTIEALVEDSKLQIMLNREYAFEYQLKVLGWTYKIFFEADPINEGHGRAIALFKNKDISFRASMKDCDSFINDAEAFFKERLQQLLEKSMKQSFANTASANHSHLTPIAAHERTDIDVTNEMRKHDNSLMDNDDLWK